MIGVVQRGVPEGHYRVAHELVDGPPVVHDRARQDCQELVHQPGQCSGIILEILGNRSKAAHVTEQQRQVAGFTAEGQLALVAAQLLDQIGRDILAECVADLAALAFLAQVVDG